MHSRLNRCIRRSLVSARLAALAGAIFLFTANQSFANDFSITPDVSSMNLATYKWTISTDGGIGQSNPPLTLVVGQTYTFTANTSLIHPFYIKTVQGPGSLNAYPTTPDSGLDNNGVTSSATVMTFTVPASALGTLYYNCGNHASMTGTINVTLPNIIFQDGFESPAM